MQQNDNQTQEVDGRDGPKFRPDLLQQRRTPRSWATVQQKPTPDADTLSESELLKSQAKFIGSNRRSAGLGRRSGVSGMARTITDTPASTTGVIDKTDPKKLAVAMRRQFVVNLRTSGMSYTDIADAVLEAVDQGELFEVPPGYGRSSAYLDVQRYLNELRSTIQDNLIDVIDLENSRLDALLRAIWPAAMDGDTRSVRSALDIMERRSKLLGLDSAIKVDWRIELRGLEKAGLLADMSIREELGPESYANYRQFIDEIEAESGSKPGALINPLESNNFIRQVANNSSRPVLPGFEDALAIAIEEQRLQSEAALAWPSSASTDDEGGDE